MLRFLQSLCLRVTKTCQWGRLLDQGPRRSGQFLESPGLAVGAWGRGTQGVCGPEQAPSRCITGCGLRAVLFCKNAAKAAWRWGVGGGSHPLQLAANFRKWLIFQFAVPPSSWQRGSGRRKGCPRMGTDSETPPGMRKGTGQSGPAGWKWRSSRHTLGGSRESPGASHHNSPPHSAGSGHRLTSHTECACPVLCLRPEPKGAVLETHLLGCSYSVGGAD